MQHLEMNDLRILCPKRFFPYKSYSYGDDEREMKICLRVGGASDTRLVH